MEELISKPVRVHVGVGSNLGDARAYCLKAVQELDGLPHSRVIRVSSLYRTEPVGYEEQNWFVNCALVMETRLSPHRLLAMMQQVEKAMGRKRSKKWGPRTIDLDILFYDGLVVQEEDLEIPHPRMAGRRFVLAPLKEIDPHKVHPVLNKTVAQLYLALEDNKEVIRIP